LSVIFGVELAESIDRFEQRRVERRPATEFPQLLVDRSASPYVRRSNNDNNRQRSNPRGLRGRP